MLSRAGALRFKQQVHVCMHITTHMLYRPSGSHWYLCTIGWGVLQPTAL
jgi:hypothetical protein